MVKINRKSIFYKIHPFFLILLCLPIFYYKTSSLIIGYFFTVIFLYSCGMIFIFMARQQNLWRYSGSGNLPSS